MRKLIRLALVASVLYGAGAHWAALQTYAWAAMAMAGKTDPCRVCRMVEKGTAAPAPKIIAPGPAADLAVPAVPRLIVALPANVHAALPPPFAASAPSRPVVPPPKPVLPA